MLQLTLWLVVFLLCPVIALFYLPVGAMPLILFLLLLHCWLAMSLIRQRRARQNELLNVISMTVNSNQPLVPALRSYAREEAGWLSSLWTFIWSHLLLAPWYFWFWHLRNNFGKRIDRLANQLEKGKPLADALRDLGLARRETCIAIALGQESGHLSEMIAQLDERSFTAAWIELLPRLIYPFFLVLIAGGIVSFLMISVMPKFQKIFYDFKTPLPEATSSFLDSIIFLAEPVVTVCIVFLAVLIPIVGALLIVSSRFRWRFPIIGHFYRWDLRGLVLRSLGALLKLGKTIPDAMRQLVNTASLPAAASDRLRLALAKVERGEALGLALQESELLAPAMVPLVTTAQRVNSLPWTLTELGSALSGRALRYARRLSLVFAPLSILAIGCLVLWICLAFFMPLIRLLESLSQ